jgi:hypothetical protein
MNWRELAISSHYQTAVAIKNELEQGHIEESTIGIEELIDALSRSEKRVLRSQLTRLMTHIIKWQIQPERRSRSWLTTIENARIEIEEILEEEPHLKPQLPQLWDKCFNAANRLAQKETGIKSTLSQLTQAEVFQMEYFLAT